jgi:hypothetical protein
MASLAWTAIATAGSDNYTMRMAPSGKAAARAVMLTQSDVGAGWTGGLVKPDLSIGARCANYHPRLSDLVLNGAAKATYKQPGFGLSSAAQVLGTANMVRLDWQRSVASPHFIACMRTAAVKAAKHFKATVISLRPLAVPRMGDFSGGYRMVIDYAAKNGKVRMVIDTVAFASGRTEMALTTTMPITGVATLVPNEAVLAKLMLARARA